MRTTKALVCAAAVAAGAISAMAQSNVYSLNVVGYINVPLKEGLNLVANQLDIDGYGTNNTVQGVFSTNLPFGSAVYTWNGTGYNFSTYGKDKSGNPVWTGNDKLNPGQGAWVKVPAGAYSGATGTVTTVGNVLQGSLVNPNIPAAGGLTILSAMAPKTGTLVTDLGYTPAFGDNIYTWNGTTYDLYAYGKDKSGNPIWTPGQPTINVGQGFWVNAKAGASWSNYFIVQ